MPSSINLYQNQNELSVTYKISIEDDEAPFHVGYPSPDSIFTWVVCTLNTLTLEPKDGTALEKYNHHFSTTFDQNLGNTSMEDHYILVGDISDYSYPLVDYPEFTFEMVLDPQVNSVQPEVYRPIVPHISGGTSVFIFMESLNTIETSLVLTNQSESFDDGSFGGGDGITSLSGVLTGLWTNGAGTELLPAPISGVIDYMTGNLQVDFHLASGYFAPNLSAVKIKYAGNYAPQLNTEVSYLTASELILSLTANDTESILVSCNSPEYSVFTTQYYPFRIAIEEGAYNLTTVDLTAVYNVRDESLSLTDNPSGFGRTNGFPINDLSGRDMIWRSDDANSSFVSGYSPRIGGSPSAFPISGWSIDIEHLEITATGDTDVFYISACFPDDTFGQKTTAVYVFNYFVPESETISINSETFTLTSEILKVYRTVSTTSGSFVFDPVSALTWEAYNTFPDTNLSAASGVAINDYSKQDYFVFHPYLPLTGDVGLLSSRGLSSDTGIVTAYDYIHGVNYLGMQVTWDPDVIYTIKAAYLDTPTISALHTFQIYTAPSALSISAIDFDNQPYVRSLTAKAMNYRDENDIVPLHPDNKVKWGFDGPDDSAITIKNLNGSVYTQGEYAEDTMVFSISTSTFDNLVTFPTLCTFNIQASAYDTYNSPYNGLCAISARDITVDTFPSSELFRSSLQLNYENSELISDMWRVSANPYILSATDLTFISGVDVTQGDRIINFGNGQLSSTSPASGFYYGSTGNFSVTLQASGVSAFGWLSAHSINSEVDLHLVSQFVSADFMVYPTYVFISGDGQVQNTFSDPITSFGASAYDVGHTEPFLFSALNQGLTSYNWKVGDTVLSDNTANVTHSRTTPTTGTAVYLDVYNDELAYPMPETYLDDDTGVETSYPNRQSTDNATLTSEDIRVLDYEAPDISVTLDPSSLFLVFGAKTDIGATATVTFPDGSPITEKSSTMQWTLSTPNWSTTTYTDGFDSDVTLTLTDDDIGQIKYNSSYPMILIATRTSDLEIPNTFAPNDWGSTRKDASETVDVPYTVMPEFLFYPLENYVAIGDTVTFRNGTVQTSSICAFHLSDGYDTTAHFVSPTAYSDFTTSYPIEGSFTLYVTGVFVNGQTYSMNIPEIVTVISAFEDFDPNITRIFGETELEFPYSIDDTIIPPNEWATEDTFNRSMERLNQNFEYLKDSTKFYSLPPIDYFGWLGSAVTYEQTVFKWHYNYLANYQDVTNSIEGEFTNVTDIVSRDARLYVSEAASIRVYDSGVFPSLLGTITNKTFDDTLDDIKSIGVDSTGRIYALDRINNRVVVFNQYTTDNADSNIFLFEWGGLGGLNAKTKFNNPNELYIDSDDNVWVVDTGNKAIKKYTRTGSWLQTLDLSASVDGDTTATGGIISMAIDRANEIHVLTLNGVVKVSTNGAVVGSYDLTNPTGATPVKITPMYDSGFLYIAFNDRVTKVLESGQHAGTFADNIADADFCSIHHDSSHNIYIVNSENVLKYFDRITINKSRSDLADSVFWTLNDVTLDKDEYIQDWVCNMVFKRLWDNIELFKRTLNGQIEYTTDADGNLAITVDKFTPEEYSALVLSDKDDIFVGVNELCTSEVLNRCIRLLYVDLEIMRANI
jgi:hypothetical protein